MHFLLDFQQLEPVGGPGIEHHQMKEVAGVNQYKAGTFRMWKLWREIYLCVMLTETSRFKYPLLKRFCEVIRVKGMRIPDELWKAFTSCFLNNDVPEHQRRERLQPHVAPSEEKMYLATEWALVSRMQRTFVLCDAAHGGEIVFFTRLTACPAASRRVPLRNLYSGSMRQRSAAWWACWASIQGFSLDSVKLCAASWI